LASEAGMPAIIAKSDQNEPPEFKLMDSCVLLVEDHKANVLVAVHMLESLGYHCDVVGNGKKALQKIRANRNKYAAVLMDIQMPEMDGLEATKILREEERAKDLPHLPVIAMTAHALRGDRERCITAGMDDY